MAMRNARARHKIGVLLAVGLSVLITGCMPKTGADVNLIAPAATAVPSGTKDPRATPAVSTYQYFLKTSYNMLRHPVLASAGKYPEDADFARYSVDPIQAQYESFVATLVKSHHAFRGTPPKSKVTVISIEETPGSRPTITLADCLTEKDQWRAYDTRTNVMNPQMTPGFAAPYGIMVTVTFVQQRWRVATIKPDPAGTCAG